MEGNRKRQQSTHGSQQQKRYLKCPTKVSDIGVDCLQHIFVYFEFKDLLSVADVNEQFREAANYVFTSKYSKKRIEIRRNANKYEQLSSNYGMKNEQLVLTDSRTVFQVLRCFGQCISELNFECRFILADFQRFQRFCVNAIVYINRYCADSLKWINLDPVSIGFDRLCTKPFSETETVGLFMGNVDVISLNRLFPKMQSLNLQWLINSDYKPLTIPEYYPHLQHLEFDLEELSRSVSFFQNILELNKEIRSLKIRATHSSYLEMKTIHLPNIHECTFRDYSFHKPRKIPFQFDKLKVLRFEYIDGRYLNSCHKFFKRHKSIEKLIFTYGFRYVLGDLHSGILSKSKLLTTLTSLKEIILEACVDFSIDYVIRYMLGFDSLKCFTFFCSSSDDHIKKCCGNHWETIQLESTESLTHIAPKFPLIKLMRINNV